MSFSGKVALVAGAGGGMGLAIARDLMAAGAEVGLADLKAAPEDLSGGNLYHQGDLTDPAFVAQAVEETVARFGRLDYLVNTTGVLWFDRDTSFAAMDLAVWDQVLAINLKSFVLTSRFAVPEMKKAGGGAIVHFSSIDALSGDSKPQDAYGAAKAAVIRLSKSIAVQFAGDNIRSGRRPGSRHPSSVPRPPGPPGQARGHERRLPVPAVRPGVLHHRHGTHRRRRRDRPAVSNPSGAPGAGAGPAG
jgi:3-oxoacyl-[acyl-carrier protein] reductase